MRVLLFANNWVGWQVAERLRRREEEIVGLVLHPPARRKYGDEIAGACGLPPERIFDGARLDDAETLGAIGELKPDIGVSALFGHILHRELLDLMPGGCVNVHPALLPYNRGAYPNVWSIVEHTPAGATIHCIDEGVDTGDIIAQEEVAVEPSDTGEGLYRKLERACVELFGRTWPAIRSGTAPRVPQDRGQGTSHRAGDVARIDEIDLDRAYSARELLDVIRARTFRGFPGAYFRTGGRKVHLRLALLDEDDLAREGRRTAGAITIGGRPVGPGHPAYIIAEMSANHGQDFDRAVEIIRAAKDAGADAVKLQTYTPDTLTIDCDTEHFRITGTPWAGRKLYELYAEAYMPWEWQPKLKDVADELGIDLFSTPYDASAVDFLEELGVPAYKIASFENIDHALIRKVAGTGKPVLISTGMAALGEIEEAVGAARDAGATQLALLKCTSAYPARPEEMNLRTIPDLAERFGVPVGLSDHTLGSTVAVASVAVGACLIEKHFALSRDLPGPDVALSAEPHEFKAMVEAVRSAERSLGTVSYGATEREAQSRVFRRSLFVVDDVKAGGVLTEANVRCIRPGFGLHPRHLREVLGRKARRELPRGTPLAWDDIEPEG